MRERAAATIFIWISLALSTGLILGSLKYTEMVPNPVDPTALIAQTTLVPDQWQLGAAILLFVLMIAAAAATGAIWQSLRPDERHQHAHIEKAKRHQRDARIKRLLETMDEDDLDALEQGRLRYQNDGSDETDRLSLEALLRKRS